MYLTLLIFLNYFFGFFDFFDHINIAIVMNLHKFCRQFLKPHFNARYFNGSSSFGNYLHLMLSF